MLNRISCDGQSVQIRPRAMDVLVCLASHNGDVATKQDLIDAVWRTEFVSENALTHVIAELRTELGDDAKNPTYIENIPRRGYRLLAEVSRDESDRSGVARIVPMPSSRVALRPEDDLDPYPGLAPFTEETAEFFFGRETEVARLWRTITSRRLLALIGPSGVGKTSFLRAGIVPAAPDGWGVVICQPGASPFVALARALVPEFAGDVESTSALFDIRDTDSAFAMVSRWRHRHERALLIVDQFEELFTLNPVETHHQFIGLLRRLVDGAGLHVLLSMRDDFLHRCHALEAARPIFDELSVLERPDATSLRRALVEPARRLGYAFDDDETVAEMVAFVEDEHGALPLLAFAAAQLWERRDRGRRLITREAYEAIGGVGGALARHAEATIDQIGRERLPIVRELFRNLVTAEGTRAVREWAELLSVFCESSDESPAAVLRSLIDGRLLTSYEVREEERKSSRRVEIVHESLLANWPRLVRWQTQDADAAQLRDQLRQAARIWHEHGRTDDMLWTGSSYREFAVWRERYPGGLSELEEAFASAMTSLATRRRRRRRIAAVAALALAVVIAAVFGALWRRSVLETRRAEAAKLLALAQLHLDKDPSGALAYAGSSLELSDTAEARVFALRALWKAPPARVLDGARAGTSVSMKRPVFSHDGSLLAAPGHGEEVLVWEQHGGEPIRLPGHTVSPRGENVAAWTTTGYLVTHHPNDPRVRIWSMPDGRMVRDIESSAPTWWQVGETHLLAAIGPAADGLIELKRWDLPDGDAEDLGSVDPEALGVTFSAFDPSGRGWIFVRGTTIYYRRLPLRDDDREIAIGRHDNQPLLLLGTLSGSTRSPPGRTRRSVWTRDRVTGEMRCWSLDRPSLQPINVIPPHPDPAESRYAVRDASGSWWRSRLMGGKGPLIWDLGGLPGALPQRLDRDTDWYQSLMDIHPAGSWLVATGDSWNDLVFWPLTSRYPSIVGDAPPSTPALAFAPNGRWLTTAWSGESVRIFPLDSGAKRDPIHLDWTGLVSNLVFDSGGQSLLTVGFGDKLAIVDPDGGPVRRLEGFSRHHFLQAAAFSPSGRRVAAGTCFGTVEPKALRVWDLESGDVSILDLEAHFMKGEEDRGIEVSGTGWDRNVVDLAFIDESTLMIAGWRGIRTWNVDTGVIKPVISMPPGTWVRMRVSGDRARMVTAEWVSRSLRDVVIHDLDTGTRKALPERSDRLTGFALAENGEVLATAHADGGIRVGRIDGGDAHLLVGHEGAVRSIAVSSDLRWLASSGQDGTLRLWPMPDLSKPPLQTLPHDELIAKLRSLTNLRAVRDPESATGWTIEIGPFPGWETSPTW